MMYSNMPDVVRSLDNTDGFHPVAPGLGVTWAIYQEENRDVMVFWASAKNASAFEHVTGQELYNKSPTEMADMIAQIETELRLKLVEKLTA